MFPDEPVMSPRRILAGIRQWLWWITREPPVLIPLWTLIKYHRRPFAAHRDGVY